MKTFNLRIIFDNGYQITTIEAKNLPDAFKKAFKNLPKHIQWNVIGFTIEQIYKFNYA